MNLTPLSNIASAASKLLSAVTTQIAEYAGTGKIKAQSLVPATAFLLGCLAIAMSLVESNRPREWWSALPYDVKLLLLALSGILLIILSELGRQMGLLLRQFYGGEWPTWFWSQFRIRYLEQQLDHRKQIYALNLAFNQLRRTEEKIDNFRPQLRPQIKKIQLPMLRVPINAYQLITSEVVQIVEVDYLSGVIDNPGELIGRYSTKNLDAHTPIKKDDLRAVPRKAFFEDTKVIRMTMDEPGIVNHLGAGSIVSMIIRKSNAQKTYDEILVLDRLGADTLVISVKKQDIHPLLSDLSIPQSYTATLNFAPNVSVDLQRVPGGQEKLEFLLNPIPEEDYLIGVPVAKVPIQPGQVIRLDDHIQWEMKGVEAAIGNETKLENILGTVYWPTLENGEKSNDPLEKGGEFKEKFLHTMPDQSWLTNIDSTGKPHDRIFDKVLVETDEPIHVGDRLRILDENGKVLDRFCYVIQIAEKNVTGGQKQYECYIAVSKRLELGKTYNANPFDEIPVVKKEKLPGTLISSDDIVMKAFRAGDHELFKNIYLEVEALNNSYVEIDAKELPAGKPIPRTQVLAAPKHKMQLLFKSDNCKFEISSQREEKQGQLPQRGDLVSVNLDEKVQWDRAFVCEVEVSINNISSCTLTIPEDKYYQTQKILNGANNKDPVICKITITHSDTYFIQQLEKYKQRIKPEDAIYDINQVISGNVRELDWFSVKTSEVCELIDEMQASFGKFSDRHWKGLLESNEYSPYTNYKDFMDYFWQHASIVKLWRESIENLVKSRNRGKQLSLPKFFPETRATALGNVLAAAAAYPLDAYNIDTSSLLPRLVLALGDDHKAVKQLNSANDTLSMLLLFSFWSAVWTIVGVFAYIYAYLSGVYGPWWFLLIITPGGPLLSWLSKEAALAQAYNYGEAIKVLFDTERFALFTSMGIVIPEKDQITHEQEHKYWQEFFELYAFGDMDNFPPVKLPKSSTESSTPKEGEKK